METVERFRVMWVNPDGGSLMNADDFNTEKEAQEYCDDLAKDFPDQEYFVQPYYKKIRPNYNTRAVDGWEDIYPLNEY